MTKRISDNCELVPFYDTATDPLAFHDKACEALDKMIAALKAPDLTLAEARGNVSRVYHRAELKPVELGADHVTTGDGRFTS